MTCEVLVSWGPGLLMAYLATVVCVTLVVMYRGVGK